jgi:peptidyl-prolyl cis-trans isomerase C
MRTNVGLALLFLSSLQLGACNLIGNTSAAKEPTGQVVATVFGQEITLLELRTELGAEIPSDPEAAKAAEQAALRNIIGRKALADAARARGLDKTPEFALQRLRAMDALMAQMLQAKIAAEVPAPSRDEALRYIADHRELFAERKIFGIDQIAMPRPTDPAKLKELEPLKTMAEVERYLQGQRIVYRRSGNNSMDALTTDPNLLQTVAKLPPGEVWVVSGGNVLLVNQIRDTRKVPYTGDAAVSYALDLLREQRTQETIQREFNAIAAKAKDSTIYNKNYQPPPAAEGGTEPMPQGAPPSPAVSPQGPNSGQASKG